MRRGSTSSGAQGSEQGSEEGGGSLGSSSFVMSFPAGDHDGPREESPWAASIPDVMAAPAEAPLDGADQEEEEDEDERKLSPEEAEAALAEAEAFGASSPSIAAALAAAGSVSSSAYSTAAAAVSSVGNDVSGRRQQGPAGSIGEEHRSMEQQKARGEERFRALVASKEHARRAFPKIRRVYQDHYLKIMVAGESGHGKTSFINNLFLSYTNGREVKPHDGSRTRVEEFLADPASLCTRFSVENETTLERMHYAIQDTPGYGDDTDIGKSIGMVLRHVDACNAEYLAMETDAARVESMAAQEDPRIDVCLYFIAAHRLKHIDLKFMRAIAARVALIPVIAKADSMTAEETVSFRGEIMAECEAHRIPIFDFGADVKASVGIPPDLVVPPFAVVASNKFDEVRGAGSFWPVRDYHWGTCEAFSTQHSDCTYLKRLLLEEGFHDLRRATEQRYLQYRRDHFAQEAAAQCAAVAVRRAQRTRCGLLIGLAALLLAAGLAALLQLHGDKGQQVTSWGSRGPLAFLFGRWGGGGDGGAGEEDDQLQALSARLQGKEAELAAAQQTIDLLVSSVRSLEASMSRLVGGTNGDGKQRLQLSPHHGSGNPGGGGGGAKPLFVRVEEEDVVSAKSLSEIDRLLHRMGVGGLLPTEVAATEDEENGGQEERVRATVAGSNGEKDEGETDQQTPLRNNNSSNKQRTDGPSSPPPPQATKTPPASSKRAPPLPSASNPDGGRRHQYRRQQPQQKHRCAMVGAWLEGVVRFHEEKVAEGWEMAMRWFH